MQQGTIELASTVKIVQRTLGNVRDGGLMHYNTTQSVGDGSACTFACPPMPRAAGLRAYDTGVQPVKNKEGHATPLEINRALVVNDRAD